MQAIYKQLIESGINKENILVDELMSKHTSFKVGGKTDLLVKVYLVEEIKSVLKISKENNIPLFVMGNGTNLLVKDEGFRGIILQIKLEEININGTEVVVGSGVKNVILSKKLTDNSLTGFEFASGIPGTIGGAIKMNAGACGGEIKDIASEVTYLDYDGNIHTINNLECNFEYRHSRFFDEKAIILEAKLKLEKGNKADIESKVKQLLQERREKQPLEYPNAGSTFKRGEGFITAKLIDECGLKGYGIGGAEVSEKHAGFIINKDNATSIDIINLIEYVQKKVKEKTGKDIKLEIEIIGG